MGTKGSTGMEKIFLGSSTVSVIKGVQHPILAIPTYTSYTPPLKIAFATDYKELKYDSVFNPLAELAEQYQSELMIINIKPEGKVVDVDEAVSGVKMHRALEKIPHRFYSINDSDVAKGIELFVHEHDIDMLAMVARQHTFFEKNFSSSITEQLSKLADIPLLILHEK